MYFTNTYKIQICICVVSRLYLDEWFEHSSDEYHCVQCPVCSPPSQDSFEFLELTKEPLNISWPTSVRSVGNSMSSWFCYKPKTRFYWACDDVHVDSSQDFWNMKTTVLLLQVIFLASLCHGQRKYSSCHLFLVIYEQGDLPDTYKMNRYTYSSWFSIYKPRTTLVCINYEFFILTKMYQWMKIEKKIIKVQFKLFLTKYFFFLKRTETGFALLHLWINLFYGTWL